MTNLVWSGKQYVHPGTKHNCETSQNIIVHDLTFNFMYQQPVGAVWLGSRLFAIPSASFRRISVW